MARAARRLALIIYDPRRFMYVLSRVRARKINYYIPDNIGEVHVGDIVYTDDRDVSRLLASRGVKVFYDPKGDNVILEKAILAIEGKDMYNEVSIGIDPGNRHTVVAIGDGKLLEYHVGLSNEELRNIIIRILNSYPARKRVVRVGCSGHGVDVAYMLRDSVREASIELINEYGSSPDREWRNPFIERIIDKSTNSNIARRKDIHAAIRIALKRGVVVGEVAEARAKEE